MSIISISSLSYSAGEEIARRIAARLDYEGIDKEVFHAAAQLSGFSQHKLEKALTEAPGLLTMSPATRKLCAAHVKTALIDYFLKDNVVYHGPFGTHMIHGVSHCLKVRIYAQLEERALTKSKQDGSSLEDAKKAILKSDKQRLELAHLLYSVDDDKNDNFDLLVNASRMDVETACEVIEESIKHKRYQPMTYSINCLKNLSITSQVRSSLVDIDPNVEVVGESGNIWIQIKPPGLMKKRKLETVRQRATRVAGVKKVEIEVVDDIFDRIHGA
jgi:cytidylate kinase